MHLSQRDYQELSLGHLRTVSLKGEQVSISPAAAGVNCFAFPTLLRNIGK